MTSNFNKTLRIAAVAAAFAFGAGTTAALADSFSISYLAPGVQAPSSTNHYETFDSSIKGPLVTNFNGSGITGTYSGNYTLIGANAWGGAGGSQYIKTNGSATSYSLKLSQPVNYFGLWFSALDPGNSLSFYKGSSLVETFSPTNFIAMVGACPSASNPFCGNPNNGLDPTEQFAYLNFYDSNGTFDTVVFSQQLNIGEFESDNHAVDNLTAAPTGTPIDANTPEPASLLLVGTGILSLAAGLRYRFTERLTQKATRTV
jgi:hypothetical protein